MDLIPTMRDHLRSAHYIKGAGSGKRSPPLDPESDGTEDYSHVFKELFCVAALELAGLIQEPLDKLGVLYDEILSTGTLGAKARIWARTGRLSKTADLEKGSPAAVICGRGQLLFVVRSISRAEANQSQARGYRFATITNVTESLARGMQVSQDELRPRLESMHAYSKSRKLLEPGVHLVCFAIRPMVNRGFDVLVCKDFKSLPPTTELPIPHVDAWHVDYLSKLDSWTVNECIRFLETRRYSYNRDEQGFARCLVDGIRVLARRIKDPVFLEARLTARPLKTPCYTGPHEKSVHSQATIIAFRIMTDIHLSQITNSQYEFIPARFFLCQQHVYKDSPDHDIFAARAHRELGLMIQRKNAANPHFGRGFMNDPYGSPVSNHIPLKKLLGINWKQPLARQDWSPTGTIFGDNSSSEKHLVEDQAYQAFGGIHVFQEVTVDVSEAESSTGEQSPDWDMRTLGNRSEVGVVLTEKETYVDELMALTISEKVASGGKRMSQVQETITR